MLGLPSSADVSILSNMIRALRDQATNFIGEPIAAAIISVPHLNALYGEDLYDAFEYLSLTYLEFFPFWNMRPYYSSIAAYAGNGLGLCANYRDVLACEEEESRIEAFYALSVSYTHTSLMTSQARVANARYLQDIPRLEDLYLGYDTGHERGQSYWDAVRHMLRSPILDSAIPRNITMVLVYGDATEEPRFREVLREVVDDVIDGEPAIIDRDPEFSSAKGAAEIAKRTIFSQKRALDTVFEL